VKKYCQSSLFNLCLQLPNEELYWDVDITDHPLPEDGVFTVNPHRLRGSDFLMRWAQGRWAEEIVIQSLNQSNRFRVVPYGPSTVAPEEPSALESFFEKMDVIAQEGKRPDILLYDMHIFERVQTELIERLGSIEKMAETPSFQVHDLIARSRAAIEIENSLWVTEKMPGVGKPFSRYTRGKNKGRLKPSGVIPTIIVKVEDVPRLQQWEANYGVPIYVVHVFFDRAYFIKFSNILSLVDSGELSPQIQRYTNPDGTAASSKQILKDPYILCKEFGIVSGPQLVPRTFVDKNGKVMTYVTFEGGEIALSPNVFEEWED